MTADDTPKNTPESECARWCRLGRGVGAMLSSRSIELTQDLQRSIERASVRWESEVEGHSGGASDLGVSAVLEMGTATLLSLARSAEGALASVSRYLLESAFPADKASSGSSTSPTPER